MRSNTALLTALLCACGGSSPTPDAPAKAASNPTETRCYEGEYRLYDAAGGIRDTSLVAVRYTIGDDEIVMEDIERGAERSSQTFAVQGDTIATSSDDYTAAGTIRRDGETIELQVEGSAGENITSTTTTIGPEAASEIWRISNDADGPTAGYILQHLIRVDDDACDERFDAIADGTRPTLARRGNDLVERASRSFDETAPETVTFSYQWPRSVDAIVWADMTRERSGQQATSRTPYELRTTPTDSGTKVLLDAQYSELLTGDGNEAIRNAVQATDYLAYPFVVDPTGAIAGIADYATTSAIARTGIQAQIGAEASARVDEAFTERGMLQSVSKFWDPMIGAWRGATMQLGEVRQNVVEVPIASPFGGTIVVRAQNEFAALGRVPCRAGDEKPTCVLVQMTQSTDPEHAASLLASAYDQLEGERKPPKIDAYQMEFTALTVIEPNTLLPFEYLELTNVAVSFVDDGTGSAPPPARRVEAKTLTFHYRSDRTAAADTSESN